MKRYLFNTVSDPRQATNWKDAIRLDRLEHNPGDMVYTHGVMNLLSTDSKMDWIPTGYYYDRIFGDEEIDRINATCSAFILPMADIFSKSWARLLPRYTQLVCKLKIPCIVPCVGMRDDFDPENPQPQSFDARVVAFVKAILNHSAVMGVRGRTTYRYLQFLGFRPELDFTTVGCPSIYALGRELPFLRMPKNKIAHVAFHLNGRATEDSVSFVDRITRNVPRRTYVSQDYREFLHFLFNQDEEYGRWAIKHPLFAETLEKVVQTDSFRFFLNYRPWFDFLQSVDFSVGHRIHGTLLSLLAGAPAVLVPFESRTLELAEYHEIPYVHSNMFNSIKCVEDLLGMFDEERIRRKHRANFDHFVDFLHQNGLETIFDDDRPHENVPWPLFKGLSCQYEDDGLLPYSKATKDAQTERDAWWNLFRTDSARLRV